MSTLEKDAIELAVQWPSGAIDGIRDGHLHGWLHVGAGKGSLEVVLLINGEKVGADPATDPRPDVLRHFADGLNSGFKFDLSGADPDHNSVLRVLHEPSGYDFAGATFLYSPFTEASIRNNETDIRTLFFPEYYRYRYGLEMFSNDESYRHFLENGIYQDFDPSPWFSNEYYRKNHSHLLEGESPVLSYFRREGMADLKPSPHFDPVEYLGHNEDLKGMRLLEHYMTHGNTERRRTRTVHLPTHIIGEIRDLATIEPALAKSRTGADSIVRYPFVNGATYVPRLLQRRLGTTNEIVLCTSYISLGGADLIATYLLRAYQQAFGIDRVILIVTDRKQVDVPEWIDPDTQLVCLDLETDFLDRSEKITSLHSIIGLLSPQKVINVNSHVAWDMYRTFGTQMATVTRLYAYLFCFDYDTNLNRAGYIVDYVPETIEQITEIYCDNGRVVEEIRDLYDFPAEVMDKFKPVYVPASPFPAKTTAPVPEDLTTDGRSILWVARLARQKRPDLLIQIANAMPGQNFVVYGPTGDSPACEDILDNVHENIEYRGVYTSLSEIRASEYHLFLNTSAWEGLPTILIQIMSMGIPVVTSLAGGISELVDERTGWPVETDEDASAYVTQISRALINETDSRDRAANGRQLIDERHSWEAFYERLNELGAFTRRRVPGPDGLLVDERELADRRGCSKRTAVLADRPETGSVDIVAEGPALRVVSK